MVFGPRSKAHKSMNSQFISPIFLSSREGWVGKTDVGVKKRVRNTCYLDTWIHDTWYMVGKPCIGEPTCMVWSRHTWSIFDGGPRLGRSGGRDGPVQGAYLPGTPLTWLSSKAGLTMYVSSAPCMWAPHIHGFPTMYQVSCIQVSKYPGIWDSFFIHSFFSARPELFEFSLPQQVHVWGENSEA